MIIDCISDLHGHYPKLDGGDLLIIAGDFTAKDTLRCWINFFNWFDVQNYRKKIYIGGNHDNFLTQCCTTKDSPDIIYGPECEKQEYLCDSGTEFEGLKIWGSPWTKTFPGMNPNCKAFTVDTEDELWEKWNLMPVDTDILITHCPPHGMLDYIYWNDNNLVKRHLGSVSLAYNVKGFQPKLHVFGHIHENGGKMIELNPNTKYVNASHVNERYEPVNKPVRIIL